MNTGTMNTGFFTRLASMVALIAILAAGLAGCNTTEGVGKDVKAAGRGLENAARDAK